MTGDVILIEATRGDLIECTHRGHVVVCDGRGEITFALGNPEAIIYPRSSCKIIQALPLMESGAADAARLRTDQLALCCASHSGAAIHTDRVQAWLADLGLSDDDFRCGPQEPRDRDARDALIRAGNSASQVHNVCSGKHSGFLTLNRYLGGGAEYVDPDHPVQKAVLAAFEDVTGEMSPGFGFDGCSAPTFATSMHGLARAMAFFATSRTRNDLRARSAQRLLEAMITHPELVSAPGKPTTELMRLAGGRAAIKSGAEGLYVAMIPDLGLGVAIKIMDGSDSAKSVAIANVLRRLGVLPGGPHTDRWSTWTICNRRNMVVGEIRPAAALA